MANQEQRAARAEPPQALSDPLSRNIADIIALEKSDSAAAGPAQRRLEDIGRRVAQPAYALLVLLVIGAWIAFNLASARFGIEPFDPPPFPWLQGLLTFTALLTATVVLIAQSRQARLSEQRAHLDLQINLLTEQKVTKLIHLIEELREALPSAPDRSDPHMAELKKPTDAVQILSELKKTRRDE
jgi:uncharacterized membrane protein